MNQDKILKIIMTWKIKKTPEYRGFRCGKCQKPMRKAWHIWLTKGGFKSEVHLCNKCFKEIK